MIAFFLSLDRASELHVLFDFRHPRTPGIIVAKWLGCGEGHRGWALFEVWTKGQWIWFFFSVLSILY